MMTTLIGLAAYRLARIPGLDQVAEPFQGWLHDWVLGPRGNYRTKQWFQQLVLCPICLGWWLALIIGLAYGYLATDLQWETVWLATIAAAGVEVLAAQIDVALMKTD